MATYLNGILGNFSGTVGSVVGVSRKGIKFMRAKSGKRGSSTPAQQVQAAKFTLAAGFLRRIKRLVKFGFRDLPGNLTARNQAFSIVLKKAITGEFPDLAVDYSKVQISDGSNVANTDNATASAGAAGNILFNWRDNSNTDDALANDKAVLVAYCPALERCVYNTAGPIRSAGTATLEVPGFSGKEVHTWLAFVSADGKDVAKSVYTGKLNVV